MEMWTNLGIEKTKDIDAITEAYHEKLKLVHPEEKPEEFMALRAEYEEALKYAQETEETEEKEKTPIDLWIEKVEAVYNDISKRTDVNEWQELLKDEVCQALDSRLDARNALLRSTMENCALPMNVWQLLESEFSFTENKEALYEIFPKDFIDNCVLSGLVNIPTVPYELFAEGTTGNPDCYFELYGKAVRECRDKDFESAEATIKDLENTGFVHPYTEAVKARLLMGKEEYDKALEIINPLCEKYPEDIGIRNQRADINYCADRFEAAIHDYEFVLSKGYRSSRYVYSNCLMAVGEYVKAKDILVELWHDYPFGNAFKQAFEKACEKVNEYYEQKLSEGTLTIKESIDYAWSCLQSDQTQKAKELSDPLETDDLAEKCDLQNLRSKLYSNLDDCEGALKHAEEWEKAVIALPEGETEEEKKRKNKLDDIYYVQAHTLAKMERFDEAFEKAAQSIETGPQRRSECHDLRRMILRRKKDFVGALHEAEAMAEAKPGSWTYFVLGTEQYDMGRLQDAFNSFGESLEYTLELECYIYRIRILCDVEQYEGAQSIIDFLDSHEIKADSLSYCKARMLEGKGEKEEALKLYYEIIANIEKNESDVNFPYEVYYRVAELERENKTIDEVLETVNKGLEYKDNYYDLLYLKTTLLENKGMQEEAIKIYDKIDEEYPGRYNLNVAYANDYYDLKDYEKALYYYEKRLETNENAPVHDMIGLCLLYLNRIDEAQEHFKKAVEIDNNNVRLYSNLALSYEDKFEFEKSLEFHKKAVEVNNALPENERKVYVNRCYARALARAGRYEEAAEAYRKNLEMFGRDDDARYVIETYIESADHNKSIEHIIKYKAEGKITDLQYNLMMADVCRMQGDMKAYFRYISKTDKDDAFHHQRLGGYYLQEGKLKKAIQYFRKSEELDSDRLNLYSEMIECLRKLGDKEGMNACLSKAISLFDERRWDGDELAMKYTKYAFAYVAAGENEKAKPFIDKALTMPLCEHCRYSKCKDAYLALAEYYENMGDYDKAIEICREGAEIAKDEYDFVYIAERIRREHKKELKKENRK